MARIVTTLRRVTGDGGISGRARHGFDAANLDKSCAPCKDFNQFAAGGWVAKNPIPPSYPSWGVTNEVVERNREILRGILESAAKNTAAAHGSNDQKLGDFFGTCMDTAEIDRAGLKPLQPELDRIEHMANVSDLEAETAPLAEDRCQGVL